MSVVSATSSVVNRENAHDYIQNLLHNVSVQESEKVAVTPDPDPIPDDAVSMTSSVANERVAKDYIGGLFDNNATPR